MGEIVFKGYDKKAKLVKGKSILSYLQELGIDINATCGGVGECKQCLVKVKETGSLGPMTDAEREFLKKSEYRLACQARILREDEDVYVEIPKRDYEILERGKSREVILDPLVKVSLSDRIVYWNGRQLGRYEGELYGVALDIGTTTLNMYCIDLETGGERDISCRENPQLKFGNDIISRITYARDMGQRILEEEIRKEVNEMIQLCPVNPDHIYEVTLVGNSTMRDLFIGNPVEPLGEAPFEPVSKKSVNKTVRELGLMINPKANVYAFPLIGGFVGGDALGVILATEMYKNPAITMAIDIGTNTEVILGNSDRILATSCASGPAFEGSGIRWGVGGVRGAIKKIEIDDDLKVRYETIDDLPPIGICGSGLIDALAQMLDRGIINWRGRFPEGKKEFTIAEGKNPITISGEDVDKLMLAKSAISLGRRALMEKYGVKVGDLDKLYLAGAFGNFINAENAKKVGLLPEIELEKVEKVGNAAFEGARLALISKKKRFEVEELATKVEHVRLEREENLIYKFMSELRFRKYKPN